MKRRAVFFDRDGTLCREVGYVNHPSRLALLPGTAESIRRINELGWAAIVATNQAGAARGYFPPHLLLETHRRLHALLAREGARLDRVYACTHHPEVGAGSLRRRCECRKPRPGMLLRAAAELDLDLSRSFMVGDSFRDVGAGKGAGVAATVLLRTGYGRGEILWKGATMSEWPDHVADDLPSAVDWIVRRAGAGER